MHLIYEILMNSIRHMEDSTSESIEFDESDWVDPNINIWVDPNQIRRIQLIQTSNLPLEDSTFELGMARMTTVKATSLIN